MKPGYAYCCTCSTLVDAHPVFKLMHRIIFWFVCLLVFETIQVYVSNSTVILFKLGLSQMFHVGNKATFKSCPRNIFCNRNHFYVIILDLVLPTYYLSTVASIEPKWSSKRPHTYQWFLGFQRVWGLCASFSFCLPLASSSCSETKLMCQLFKSTLSLCSLSRCHNINF